MEETLGWTNRLKKWLQIWLEIDTEKKVRLTALDKQIRRRIHHGIKKKTPTMVIIEERIAYSDKTFSPWLMLDSAQYPYNDIYVKDYK